MSRLTFIVMELLLMTITPLLSNAAESATLKDCPQLTENFRSRDEGALQVPVTFHNDAPIDIYIRWVDRSGTENKQGLLAPDDTSNINSFAGHGFRFYSRGGVLLHELRIKKGGGDYTIPPCYKNDDPDFLKPRLFDNGRDYEFEKYAHDPNAECSPPKNSQFWSCIRYTPKERLSERDPKVFGFIDKYEAGHRAVGETVDTGYVSHIPDVRIISNGPGFLKMDQTDAMKKALQPWYTERKKDSMRIHPPIPGGYTNSHAVSLSKIDLDLFPEKRAEIVQEMQQVLQWWTNQTLRHTSTFGVRIYHRDSMLINHVDRADTHLASAVIQIAQEVDENGGWPLEVLDDEGNAYEIFLQPGEMVLYEGARLRHGRPMRFRGTEFANIFSHFAPLDWRGPEVERQKREREEL